MRCPSCHSENPEWARSCTICAAPLDMPASITGLESAEPFGQRLERLVPKELAERLLATRGQAAAERRLVTLLFSDVQGSTTLAESLDPEDLLEIINGAFEFMIAPVYRYEGTLARLMGDAILAFFGAPIAHEDDPERACRVALDILAGAQDYAARLVRERGVRGLNVRVGINTGLVVVGEVGSDLRAEYTAIGDAINVAARLEAAAEPGTILISQETYELVAPLFDTMPLGPIQVKGRAEPVAVHRLLGTRRVSGKPRGIAGLHSPLVGREAELKALQEAIARLQVGAGGVVTITGEAGIGKSRLVAEAKNACNVYGSADASAPAGSPHLQWVEGRCLSYGTSIAYLLWLDVLRALVGIAEEAAPPTARDRLLARVRQLCPEHTADVYPYLARLLSLPLEPETEAALSNLAGQQLKAKTFQAVETVISHTAQQQPLVVVCEDLHWADPSSLELLQRLLALSGRVPVLWICLLRPVHRPPFLRIEETARRLVPQRYTSLSLAPLSPAESETLVGNLLRVGGLPSTLKERILQQAEGNPFYVEEILRSLIGAGAVAPDEARGHWQAVRDVTEIAIPNTLQGVLMERIDRLGEDTKRVLQAASVIGRVFPYRVLQAIVEQKEELVRHLAILQQEEMIREHTRLPELEFIFKHCLTQEAAYSGLLKRNRRVYHRRVATALEELFPERLDEMAGVLAYHWERAAVAGRAIDYLLRAGDQARALYAHQEAIGFYERALVLLRRQGDTEGTARTLMKLGLTHHMAFDLPRSRAAYDEGFVLWHQTALMPPAVPRAPHPLRLNGDDPTTLDPRLATGLPSLQFTGHLFRGLVEFSAELDVVPDAAASWEVRNGGLEYVFHLRDDLSWSDGAPLTAHDFEHAWKGLLDPAVRSPNAELLYGIRNARAFHQGLLRDWAQLGVRTLDPYTLIVELERPMGHFLLLLACPATFAVPRHRAHARSSDWTRRDQIVTSGPFLLGAWQRGERLTLTRNPLYRGRSSGNVQDVEVTLLPASQWRRLLSMYEVGDLDVLNLRSLPLATMDRARHRHAGDYVSGPRLSTTCAGLAVNQAPFDDDRVRRALAMTIDREALPDVVAGYVLPATGGFIPPGMPAHSPRIALPFDPVKARRLLAEAGYPGGRGFPRVSFLCQPDQLRIIEPLRALWRAHLNLEIPREAIERSATLERLKKRAPCIFLTHFVLDYPDPDNILKIGPPGYWQEIGGWNEEVSQLVEQARQSTDPVERVRLYQQADRLLVMEATLVPLIYSRWHRLMRPWVRLAVSPLGMLLWKDAIVMPHR